MPTNNANYVYLNGYIDVPFELLDKVKNALVTHIALTRAENGLM